MVSSVTAARRMSPVVMYFTASVEPTRSMPLPTIPMINPPKSAPLTRPRPPKRLTPPITAAEIESRRSVPPPAVRSIEFRREARMTPPSPAIPPEIAKTMIRISFTLIPARRAASAFPATAPPGAETRGGEAGREDDRDRPAPVLGQHVVRDVVDLLVLDPDHALRAEVLEDHALPDRKST